MDLGKLSDQELVKLVTSKNEWMSRHSRRLLAERFSAWAKLQSPAYQDSAQNLGAWQKTFASRIGLSVDVGGKAPNEVLRVMWALTGMGGIADEDAARLANQDDEFVRGWALQLVLEDRKADATLLTKLKDMAATDKSPVVRRYIASGLQRLPIEQRWPILTELLQHSEDIGDHNLPLLYWYAAEGCVATDPDKAIDLLKACKIPKVREFITRRLATASFASAQ